MIVTIVEHNNREYFEKEINRLLSEGWGLYHDTKVVAFGASAKYVQTMIKSEHVKKEKLDESFTENLKNAIDEYFNRLDGEYSFSRKRLCNFQRACLVEFIVEKFNV